MLSVTDFVPKGIMSGVRVQAGLYLDMLDAERSPKYFPTTFQEQVSFFELSEKALFFHYHQHLSFKSWCCLPQ